MAVVITPDDPNVASEDTQADTSLLVAEQKTAEIVRRKSSSPGLLYNTTIASRGKMRTALRRLRYMDGGTLRPIDARWRDLRSTHPNFLAGCITNGMQVGLDVDRWKHCRNDDFHFKTRPLGIGVGGNPQITAETAFPVKRVKADRLRIDGLWPFNIPTFYQIQRNRVKEALVLSPAILSSIPSDTTLRFRYETELISGSLSPQVDNGSILLSGDLIMERPHFIDASSKHVYGQYELGVGYVDAVFDSNAVRAMTGPAIMDPTVTAVTGSHYARTTDTSGFNDPYNYILKIDLPDIGAGSTLDSASLFAYMNDNSVSSPTFPLEVRTDSDVSWDLTTIHATLETLVNNAFDPGVTQTITSGTSTGWIEWASVEGTTANADSLASAYDGVTNPGNWTVILGIIGNTGSKDNLIDMYYSQDDEASSCDFDDIGTANEPYIEITYTDALSGSPWYYYECSRDI